MNLVRIVCCLCVALFVAPSMGCELPIGAIEDTPNVHHTAGHQRPHPMSCRDVTHRVSGVYRIQPEWPFQEPMLVYCDQDYESGGWTVIQRRIDGAVDFKRTYENYVKGFGNIDAEFWLGLENIYSLAKSAPHELVVLLEHFSGNTSYAKYALWDVVKNVDAYSFTKCDSYSGSAGDVFSKVENKFYTSKTGGYWPRLNSGSYEKSNLNREYAKMHWGDFEAGSIKATKMMIRSTKPKE